ncbi:MAG TPA: hypothetical protein VHZ27_05195, partial [Solirubrobacteraceae bacterium]|nr:hypothetical protein [Solirubrobacteraceae bacterium]
MSKRQRRRVNERRHAHMRRAVPLALVAVAAPAAVAPAAQAAPRAVHLDGTVLNGLGPHHNDSIARAENRFRRERAFAAKALGNVSRTMPESGFYRPRSNRPLRLSAPVHPAAPARPSAPATSPAAIAASGDSLAGAAIAPAPVPTPAPVPAPTTAPAPSSAAPAVTAAPVPLPSDATAPAAPATPAPAETQASPLIPEAGSAIAPAPVPTPPDTTAAVPAAPPSPADAGIAIAPPTVPAPPPSAADAGGAIAPTPAPATAAAPATPSATPQDQVGPPAPPTNPDAPPMVPNPTPATGGTGGVSVGASYYEGVGGGATLVVTPQGAYIVPEIGIGAGPSVSAAAGSNVNVPNAPQVQLGFTGGDQIGPVGYRGSATVTVPLNDPSLQNTNVGANFGFNAPGTSSLTNIPGTNVPLTNLRVGGNYSPAAGPTGGVQYSATNQLFDVGDQWKLAVRVPIPLPNPTQTTAPDSNGVSDVITPTGAEGPPAMSATRDVSNLGYPDGQGDTVTVNPDGSYTLHTPTSDVTNFGPYYQQQQGLDSSQGGQLTHQLIDTLGQRTDQWSWKGNDGSTVTQTPSGTLTQSNQDGSTIQQSTSGVVTQTNPDGSTVSYDPSTGNTTTSDGHWFGTTTTFYPDGSVSQTN